MSNQKIVVDKSTRCCATCKYWYGWRECNSLGTFTYDMSNREGICNAEATKGFSGSKMSATCQCVDYDSMF